MGDRAVVVVRQFPESPDVVLYTHWGGRNLPEKLQDALEKGVSRWDDPCYLTRIILCGMMDSEEVEECAGYGIGTSIPGDLNRDILKVDCIQKEVSRITSSGELLESWSFESFTKAPIETVFASW